MFRINSKYLTQYMILEEGHEFEFIGNNSGKGWLYLINEPLKIL